MALPWRGGDGGGRSRTVLSQIFLPSLSPPPSRPSDRASALPSTVRWWIRRRELRLKIDWTLKEGEERNAAQASLTLSLLRFNPSRLERPPFFCGGLWSWSAGSPLEEEEEKEEKVARILTFFSPFLVQFQGC